MKTTYLFKEETTNGQKKLRIGTAQEFAKIAEQNRTLPIEERRYFIKEGSPPFLASCLVPLIGVTHDVSQNCNYSLT